MIVLIHVPYISLLNLAWRVKCLFLRNTEPLIKIFLLSGAVPKSLSIFSKYVNAALCLIQIASVFSPKNSLVQNKSQGCLCKLQTAKVQIYKYICLVRSVHSLLVNTLQPLYNMVRYNTVLDITRFKDGFQKCIDYIEK